MNKCVLIGRLTRDPDVRYTQSEEPTAVARYTLAVDRKYKRDGDATADFINCVAFGRQGEFAEKYLHQGLKIAVIGRIQTGSYTNQEGRKIYTTNVVVEEHDFCEKKADSDAYQNTQRETDSDGFMNVPDGIEDELPFH